MPEDKKQTNWKMPQEQTAIIDTLWNKLQSRENTKFITIAPNGQKAETPMQKELLMRKNIEKYKDANLNNNINVAGMGLEVDKNFANLSPKDKKVLEASSKALDALDKVKEYGPKNLRPYDKVDSYLKQIDNVDLKQVDLKQVDLKQIDNVEKPGRIKQAIKAAGNLGSELRVKLSKHIPSLKPKTQDKKEEKTR